MRQIELYKYNPGQCLPEEIEATFVAREGVLDSILGELRARATSPTNQHFLMIGPRGIGKTNLLIMIRSRVRSDKELSRAYFPLQTAEEEYSIASLRDFFSRIVHLLMEEESYRELQSASQSITATDKDEDATERAIHALKHFCKRCGKKILLLIDNLDLILNEQMTDDAQLGRLRDVLMNDSFLVLVGAAPTHFKEVSGYERPFYNFFRLMELEDLSAEQIAELLRKRAEWDNNPAILDRFEELKPRLDAVYHLTGGNPRLALMLYQFYTSTELPEVRTALQMLLDDLTPYYKARLEKLPPQQRKVMDAFARFGQPVTPTELAQATRLPVNQINSILKRLRELGFVSIPPQQRRKTTLYIVSERVFRIWHQMRFSTASSRRLEFLIEFIRIWYTSGEWKREVDRLMGEYRNALLEKRLIDVERFGEHIEYFAEAAPNIEQRYDVEDRTVRMSIESKQFDRAEQIIKERIGKYSAERNNDRLAQSWFLMAYLRDVQERKEDEISALAKAVELRHDFLEALYNWGTALSNLARSKTGAEQEGLFHNAIEKYEAALKVKPETYQALYNWGNDLGYFARTKGGEERERLLHNAIDKYEAALKVKPEMYDALHNWGNSLADLARTKSESEQERLFQQAFEKYEAAVKGKPDMHDALNNWGNALLALAGTRTGEEQQRLFHQAFEKYEAALKVKPDKHNTLYNWGIALGDLAGTKTGAEQERLFQQAIEKYRAALKVKPDMHEALTNWGLALAQLAGTKSGAEQERLFHEAFVKYEAALKVKPDMHEALTNWGTALAELAGMKSGAEQERLYHEAFAKYEAALRVKPDMHEALNNWGLALAELAGTKRGAEQERLFHEAFKKYEAAVKMKPDLHEALTNWGNALADLASIKSGTEQERLYHEAFENYEAAVKVKPDKHKALNNWGNALAKLAGTRSGADQERLLREVFDKYEAALKVKPDMHAALNNWGNALGLLAKSKSGAEQERALSAACDKYNNAIQVAKSKGLTTPIKVYSANFIDILLDRCALAVGAENLGDARELFTDALEYLPRAHLELSREALVRFFSAVLTERTVPFCTELFDAMRKRNMENELKLLEPFEIALKYWKKGKDEEVLDRLNPEVREIVEDIIKGKGNFRVEPSNSEKQSGDA